MNKETVLVIMPVYNAEKTLRMAVDSVLGQSYKNIHLVMVDDCSTDSSLSIMKEYNTLPNVTVVRNKENSGPHYSRNMGLYKFRNQDWGYFTTHDADDVSNPDRFSKMLRVLKNNRTNGVQDTWERRYLSNRKSIKTSMTCAHAMFKRSVFKSIGYFDLMRFGADWEHWSRLNRYNRGKSMITRGIREASGTSYVASTNITKQIPEGGAIRNQYVENISKEHEEMVSGQRVFYRPFSPNMTVKPNPMPAKTTAVKESVAAENPVPKYNNVRITVVLLSWKRVTNLKRTLAMLSRQTFDNFEVYISNGNLRHKNQVEDYVKRFSESLKVRASHDGNELYSFRRLTVSKKLAQEGTDIILFIDDDVQFDETYVEQMVRHYEPKSYKSGYSWIFQDNGADYYQKRTRVTNDKARPHYCGTGMSIIDASIFLERGLVDKAPPEALRIEDLWLSYYAQHVKKWKLGNIVLKNVVLGGADNVALHKEIISDKNTLGSADKADFLRKLVKQYKWKV